MQTDPILLIGLPRSGTTWIGKIFDSHPSTLYLHEPDSAVPMKEIPLIAASLPPDADVVTLRAVLTRTTGVRLARVAASLPRFSKVYRHSVADWFHRQFAFSAKLWTRFRGEFTLPDLFVESPEHPVRLVWKSVESVGRLGLIARLLPQARVVHLLRHPCGWMESHTRGHQEGRFSSGPDNRWWFKVLGATAPALRRGLTLESFQAMSDLERDVWSWVLWNENGAEACEGLQNVTMVLYEDVCAAPMDQARRLFEFARLDWNAQTESFVRRSVSGRGDEYYSIFRDPLTAANKWRSKFSDHDLQVVESVLRQSRIGSLYLRPSTEGP